MSTIKHSFGLVAVWCAFAILTGCESTGGGGGGSSVGVYYGVGFYDPWYYGDYDHDYDVDVTVPDRPERPERPVRPEQPIARPPEVSPRPPTASPRPASRPAPSIPSSPRPAPRGGGGGRR